MEKTSSLKKAPPKILDPIKISPFVVPNTIREEDPTGNASMGAISSKAVTNRFPQVGGNRTTGFRGRFRPHSRGRGDGNPSPVSVDDSLKTFLSPTVGGRLHSFRRDWLANKSSDNLLNIITNGYVSIHFKTKFSRSSPDSIRIQGPSKRPR